MELTATEEKAAIDKENAEKIEAELRDELLQEQEQAASDRLQAEEAQAQLQGQMAEQEQQAAEEMAKQKQYLNILIIGHMISSL